MKKKNLAIMVAVIIAVLGMFSSKALALTSAQKADLILASNGKTTSDPAVQTAPTGSENYLIRHEKLAEQVGLLTRKVNRAEKKFAGKADKRYVDNKINAISKEVDVRLTAIEDGVDEKISTALAKFETEKVTPMNGRIEAVNKKADEAKKKADASYAEGNTTRLIAIAAMVIAIILGAIGIFVGRSKKRPEAEAEEKAAADAKAKADADAKAEAEAKAAAGTA